MNGEYSGAWRNVEKVLVAVASVISKEDYQHIEQVLTQGCPFKLKFEEQESSNLQMLRRGNEKSFSQHPDIVNKVCNKEDIYGHWIPLHDWVCELGSNLRHNSQGIVQKKIQVWDGS